VKLTTHLQLVPRQENMNLSIHSSIHLHGVVLNYLNTRINLLFSQEEKRPQRRPRRKWEDNTKMDLKEIRWDGVDSVNLTSARDQLRAIVNTVTDYRVLAAV
jgi:hypothetical protein